MIKDPIAQTSGLPSCLITPIAAKTITGIQTYVGQVTKIDKYGDDAILVEANNFDQPNEFDIWHHPRANLINSKKQLWVSVDFKYYKKAYENAFPEYNISPDMCIDHIMNRKLARAFNYQYIRLVHVNKTTNTSSGRGPETLSVKQNINMDKTKDLLKDQTVYYADPFDIIKILDIPTGGKPFLDVGAIIPVLYDGQLLEIFYKDRIIKLLKDLYGFNAYSKAPVLKNITKEKLINKINTNEK